MNPPAEPNPSSGPPDEFSRKELERLDRVLAGGRWWFLAKRCARGLLPISIFTIFGLTGAFGPVTSRLWSIAFSAFAIGLVVAATPVLFYIYPLYVERAAAIRIGASYAPPQQLKDSYIFFLISLVLALACCSMDVFWSSNESVPIVRAFLFISAVVTCAGAIFKATQAYRSCPATHLRRPDCRSLLIGTILVLALYFIAALVITALPKIVDWYINAPTTKR